VAQFLSGEWFSLQPLRPSCAIDKYIYKLNICLFDNRGAVFTIDNLDCSRKESKPTIFFYCAYTWFWVGDSFTRKKDGGEGITFRVSQQAQIYVIAIRRLKYLPIPESQMSINMTEGY
jgi:hypothetical protein